MTPKRVWNFLRHYQAIVKDRIMNGGSALCHIPYCGYDLWYGAGDILIKKIRPSRIFEEKMCKAITSELPPSGAVFLDVGANIGLISLYVASHAPGTCIYAFEPGPQQHRYFAMTIQKNALSHRITLSPQALGNKEGMVQFITHFSPDSSGDGFFDTGRAGEPIPVDVQMITFDLWWKRAGKPRVDVMKLDTEGSELWILEGATEFLENVRPVLFLEIEPKNLVVYPHTRDDILVWLQQHKYSLFTLGGEECTRENFASFIGRYDTYVARPER